MITYNKLRKNITVQMQDTKVRSYTVMGFTFLTILVLSVFAIRPVLFSLSDEIGVYNDVTAKNDAIKTNLQNLAADEQVYTSQIANNVDTLNTAVPSTAETGPLFANMNAIADADKVQITSVKFLKQTSSDLTSFKLSKTPIPDIPNTSILYFEADGQGRFTDFASYVKDLENYPRTFNIIDSTVSSDQSSSDKTKGTFSLKGYVYYLTH